MSKIYHTFVPMNNTLNVDSSGKAVFTSVPTPGVLLPNTGTWGYGGTGDAQPKQIVSLPTTAKNVYNKLPMEIKSILLFSEGWLVGGSVDDLLKGNTPKDYDIIIPDGGKFMLATAQIARSCKFAIGVNTFGGLKFTGDTMTIDIWPEELDHFLKTASSFNYVYNLKRQILIKNQS